MSSATPEIEIFASGTHVAVDGRAFAFDGAALDQIVGSYDFAANPAPIVVGHPTLDAPAYGWISGLVREGDKIVAQPVEVDAAFAEAVRAGRYKRVSAAFYQPDQAGNPTPGQWHLKHVGFLGATPPAVRGLRPVAFAADIAGCAEFAFTKEDVTMTDKNDKPGAADTAAFAEAQAKLESDAAALAADQAKLAADRTALANERAAVRAADAVSFAEAQVAAGKLAPAGKDIVAGLLAALDAGTAVAFGEAGQLAPATAFKKLFDSAQPIVAFGERSKDDGAGKPLGDAHAIATAATAFAAEQAAKGITVTADAAVRHVLNQGK